MLNLIFDIAQSADVEGFFFFLKIERGCMVFIDVNVALFYFYADDEELLIFGCIWLIELDY